MKRRTMAFLWSIFSPTATAFQIISYSTVGQKYYSHNSFTKFIVLMIFFVNRARMMHADI